MKREFFRGFTKCLPVAFAVFIYGSVLGVVAAQKSLTFLNLVVMDVAVFAGTSQFLMVEMWTSPLPYFEIVTAVIIINLRYLLIGASLRPVYAEYGLLKKMLSVHFVTDENWAITMSERKKGHAGPVFLFGGGVSVLTNWVAGTVTGFLLGNSLLSPEKLALDFIIAAVFLALAVSLYHDKRDIIQWAISATVALLTSLVTGGKWYILFGGLAGAFTAALLYRENYDE